MPVPHERGSDEHTSAATHRALLKRPVDVAQPGIAIVYQLLDGLVESHDLVDAWITADDPMLGRQVLRARRRPIASDEVHILDSEPGLHTVPALQDDTVDVSVLEALAGTALHLDATRYEAGHDALTGLLDRRRFEEHLEAAVARSERHGWRFCLALLDLDSLKAVNDTYGHAAGDAVLRELGGRLRTRLRVGDIAARIGGDEFALILPELEASFAPSLLERVRDGSSERVEFSAGIAQCPDETTDREVLRELADRRLLDAKPKREVT